MPEVTQLLQRLGGGDKAALNEIIPLVYQELRQIARGCFSREAAGHMLQPTALIHEAYLRMVQQSHPNYSNRAHFYAVSARIMRQILVDHSRYRQAGKRSGPDRDLPFAETLQPVSGRSLHIMALDEALERLSSIDRLKGSLVEMRFFGGMSAEEIAECVSIPVHTVRRELRIAQAWLHKELTQ